MEGQPLGDIIIGIIGLIVVFSLGFLVGFLKGLDVVKWVIRN